MVAGIGVVSKAFLARVQPVLAAVAAIADSDANLHDLARVVEANNDSRKQWAAPAGLRKMTGDLRVRRHRKPSSWR